MSNIWTKVKNTIRENNIPIEMVIELTRRCNLNCCHCYNVKNRGELSLKQVKDMVRQLRQAGCLFAILTGGEIFTRPDLYEILMFMRRAGLDIKIFTNGTLIDKTWIEKLKEVSPSLIGISILGAKERTHDGITGIPGSFRKAMAAVELLKAAGLSVNIKCALMRQNYSEYQKIIEMAKALGVTYVLDPVISPRDDGRDDVLAHRLQEKELADFYGQQVEQFPESLTAEDDFYCSAGISLGCISARGDVFPCVQLPYAVGNIFKQELKDIWANSEFLQKMRTAAFHDAKGCLDCRLRAYCTRCPGLAYLEDQDAFGPSRTACLNALIYEKLHCNKRVEMVR